MIRAFRLVGKLDMLVIVTSCVFSPKSAITVERNPGIRGAGAQDIRNLTYFFDRRCTPVATRSSIKWAVDNGPTGDLSNPELKPPVVGDYIRLLLTLDPLDGIGILSSSLISHMKWKG
jgi:hypothetical protein